MAMGRLSGKVIVVAAVLGLSTADADANWLTHVLREAGEAGGKATSHVHPDLGSLGRALSHLEDLKTAPQGALAAHATPEGHWQFANREGQTFTVGTAEEFKRIVPSLIPDATGGNKLTLYLSKDSIFVNRAILDELPKDAELHVVTDAGAFPISRNGTQLAARLRANLKMELVSEESFDEVVSYLARPLNSSNIRTVALEPGAAKSLSPAPHFETGTKAIAVDKFDPAYLATGLAPIRGQTVLLTGRVEGRNLIVSTANGDISKDIASIRAAARDADVNLIILNSEVGRQPGGQNWLWQKIEVGGLEDARQKATFGDFLDALGARRGGFYLQSNVVDRGRMQISAVTDVTSTSLAHEASDWWAETLGHVTGEVVTKALEIDVRDRASQAEYDGRLIPGVPTYVQIPYLIAVFFAVLAWSRLRSWWIKLWPPASRSPNEGRIAYWMRRLPGEIVFWLIFVPLAAVPAFVIQALINLWDQIMTPIRWFRRKFLVRQV